MSFPTAIVFFVGTIGLAATRPSPLLVSLVTEDGPGSIAGRRLLPASFLIPATLGWVRLECERVGMFPTELSGALFVTLNIVCTAAMLTWTVIALNRADREQRRLVHELVVMASTDALTGTANRRTLLARMQVEMERARRHGTPLSLALIDADHFKRVNDQRGHVTGDLTLQRIANVLQRTTRSVDLVARFGGEEFCILLPDTQAAGALIVAERVRAAIAAEVLTAVDGAEFSVTCSIGLGVLAAETASAEDLLQAADACLYRAKDAGRNRCAGPTDAVPPAADRVSHVEPDGRQALVLRSAPG